jgi:hypothetical protein
MRQAVLGDVGPIMTALLAMLAKSPAPQMRYAEPSTAAWSVRFAIKEGRGFVLGGYFIMVDIGSDWYTPACYLIEQIILKIDPADKTATVRDCIAALDKIADIFGCSAIAVGDTQVGYMTPLYHAAGYTTLGTQLMKERTDGIRPKGNRGSSTD